jgi:hypothetical protein
MRRHPATPEAAVPKSTPPDGLNQLRGLLDPVQFNQLLDHMDPDPIRARLHDLESQKRTLVKLLRLVLERQRHREFTRIAAASSDVPDTAGVCP